jgi:RNA polymerase sigma-70 factor (ECF subfamily)
MQANTPHHFPEKASADAFCNVFAACRGELLRKALRLTRTHSDAEDLVQETAVRAWSAWDRLIDKAHRRAWLHAILRNAFVDQYRRNKREQGLYRQWLQPTASEKQLRGSDTPEPSLETWGDEVDSALKRLSEQARNVVMRVDMQEQSYDVVARALDCPMGTVMSRLYRARRRLQSELGPYAARAGYIADAA